MSVVSAHNLTRYYGSRVGVHGVSFDVAEGAIFGFLGPNGAGKTTTIRLLMGFMHPTDGSASVLGLDCWNASARIKRDVGYVPGDLRLYPWMTVRNGLKIFGKVRGMDLTRAGGELADRLRLEPDVSVRKMSRGMRQKLGIVLALAHEPKLLILDEPTSGLDPLMQDELAQYLRERVAAGATVFFSSHTLSEVEQLCDHVAIVRDGRLVADESMKSLRQRARRDLTIVFRTPEDARRIDPPTFLESVRRDGAQWRADLLGDAGPLLQWLAQQPVRDMTIGAPDLETLFRRFYRREEAS